jgi:tol-pal system protein YbgF
MKKIFVFICFVCFAFSVNADEQLNKILQELQTLNKDLKTLEKAVYSKSFSTQSSSGTQGVPAALEGALTRQLVKLSELEEQIQKITASNEETLFSLQKISDRVEKIQKDTELRFSQLENSTIQPSTNTSKINQQTSSAAPKTNNVAATNKVSGAPKQFPGTGQMKDFGKVLDEKQTAGLPANAKQEIRSVSPAPVVKTAPVAKERILPKVDPNEQYKFATNLIKVGDYEKAELALKEFIELNPQHSLAGSAQYWFAETYYIRQLYHDAAAAYLDGYQKYPKSSKAPQNLLKLGITLAELGEKEQGCNMLVGVQKQYPKADKSIIQKAKYETKKFKCQS